MWAKIIYFNRTYEQDATAKVMIEVKNRNKREAYRAAKAYAKTQGVEIPHFMQCEIFYFVESALPSGLLANVVW